jgi:dehydrogenase/reductase SDR family protein 4
MAEEGGEVIISSRNRSHVAAAVKSLAGCAVSGVVCHVGNAQDRLQLIELVKEKYGRIDVLVCSAAVSTHVGPSMEITETAFDKMFAINVKSTFFLIQEALSLLDKAVNPNILIVSSITAYTPQEVLGTYAITKTTLLAMTRVLATELAPRIRVNCVAPGVIQTNFSKAIWESPSARDNPMKRLGSVDEVAASIAFLCSDEASYITGETLTITGGVRSRL